MNGYNFSQDVRAALAQARTEAVDLKHEYVGTEHVLLGLVTPPSAIVAAILTAGNVQPAQVRDEVERVVRRGFGNTGPDLPYTSRAKKVLELTMDEALKLGADSVNAGHLLLGIMREEKGIGAQALAGLGLTLDAMRRHLIEFSGGQASPASPIERRPSSGSLELVPASAVAALEAMQRAPRIREVFDRHGVDLQAIIRDLSDLDEQSPG